MRKKKQKPIGRKEKREWESEQERARERVRESERDEATNMLK